MTSLIYGKAQHWVFLADKCDSGDYYDLPVCDKYIEQLKAANVDIIGSSRWLNAVCIVSEDTALCSNFDFVRSIQGLKRYKVSSLAVNADLPYGMGTRHVDLIKLDSLHKLGFTGKGVTIAVFDGGFTNLDSIPAFDSLWMQGRLIAQHDFVKDSSLGYDQSAHGMMVMSLMTAYAPDSLIGASVGANFVLARTEDDRSEKHIEEFNWIRAMEWADSIGVDIIHSSLGYSLFDSLQGDYTYQDMDGKSTIITIAAEIAAARGIFITNSAGNSGNSPWRYITAPCDGPNVLCVGAVDSFGMKGSFSSFGPSSDGRVKPDLMAMGVRNTIYESNGLLRTGSGTSFSGPIMASAVACLMQAHPNASNAAIMQALMMSCDRYDNPDSAYGHGIPDLIKAHELLNTLALEPVEDNDIVIYPNPTDLTLHIEVQLNSLAKIFDQQGVLVHSQYLSSGINTLDISYLTSGMYFVELTDGDIVIRRSIVVF